MSKIKILLVVLYVGFLVSLLVQFSTVFMPVRYIGLFSPPILRDNSPAGEIISGFVVEQDLTINESIIDNLSNFSANDKICAGFLYANYSNRKNTGFLKISIYGDQLVASELLDVSKLQDNTYTWTCFKDVSVEDIKQGSYLLKVEGVDGFSGESVTIWLTGDVRLKHAVINGVKSEKGLQFKMSIAVNDVFISMALWAFVFVNILGLFVFYRVFTFAQEINLSQDDLKNS